MEYISERAKQRTFTNLQNLQQGWDTTPFDELLIA